MKEERTEDKPAKVSEATQQAGETHDPWWWVERGVWTDSMLRALENGVQGGKWFRLIDKVYAERNLQRGFDAVWRNKGSAGIDGQTVQQFDARLEENIGELAHELREQRYEPEPVKRVWIDKPGSKEKRPLGIPVVRDRTVQAATRNVIEPIFEREFAEHSYGCRPGRGCGQALDRVEKLLEEGYTWIVDADLKSYFDTIPQDRLMERIKERIADGRVLALIEQFLKQGVMEELKGWQPSEQGTPQGAVLSPMLANLYLNPLDHQMVRSGWQMTRYVDDFVIQCRTQAEAEAALAEVKAWVEAEGLQMHPTKTRLVDATQKGGFDFLGYHFEQGKKWPRKKSLDKIKATIRENTLRTSGQSLEEIIQRLNRTLKGWYAYFYRSEAWSLRTIDEMVRRRLRAILMKRRKKRGIAWQQANRLWPIAFFTTRGLFRLEQTT
jgi:RNA-directed DNA polymerase